MVCGRYLGDDWLEARRTGGAVTPAALVAVPAGTLALRTAQAEQRADRVTFAGCRGEQTVSQ